MLQEYKPTAWGAVSDKENLLDLTTPKYQWQPF
jgi:hypothetical protein